MSTTYISAALRRQVIERADNLCEYCLIHENDTFFGCHIDHIVSEKHGGATEPDNLALACTFCNLHKGSDIGSFAPNGGLTRFFNPRSDLWHNHFVLSEARIIPISDIGEVTARIFQFNARERILERMALMEIGHYPHKAARERMEQ